MPTETTTQDKATGLLNMIRDSYYRMATNRDLQYRMTQEAKVTVWLEELTQLYEKEPQLWNGQR